MLRTTPTGLNARAPEPRSSLASGWAQRGQRKVAQLLDGEAMTPGDAAIAPTAPVKAEPEDADGPREPAPASEKGGSVLVRQGSLPNSLDKYLDALTVAERLAAADPENADWQRDLAVAHEKIGDALLAQGNLLAALANFRASLAIVDRLAKADAESADRQTELAMSHEKIGNVLAERGQGFNNEPVRVMFILPPAQRLTAYGVGGLPGEGVEMRSLVLTPFHMCSPFLRSIGSLKESLQLLRSKEDARRTLPQVLSLSSGVGSWQSASDGVCEIPRCSVQWQP